MKVLLAAATVGILMASCATPYQEMGILGGVRATRISEDVIQVRAQGNAYTDPDRIQQYALRKAAEETLANGYDLFVIGGEIDRSRIGSETLAVANGSKNAAWATGFSMPIIKPGETLLVRMLKGPKPSPVPAGLFDAHEVVKYLGTADASSDHKKCIEAKGKVTCE